MCGIVGYTGNKDAVEVLLCGLSKLEYRGYDSAGISVFEDNKINTIKTKGRLSVLEEKINNVGKPSSNCGIGHTRWATHGEPSDVNSHPHGNDKISLVHNGIIENYLHLKSMLTKQGYTFDSQTDTETVVKLLDYYYDGDPLAAIRKVISDVKGSYALGIVFSDFPGKIFAVRKVRPAGILRPMRPVRHGGGTRRAGRKRKNYAGHFFKVLSKKSATSLHERRRSGS